MGTRHFIGIYVENEFKVAQYGQWDGNPGGVGLDILNRVNKLLLSLTQFENKVRALRAYTKDELEEIQESSAGCTEEEWKTDYPELSRDTSDGIIPLIDNGDISAVRLNLDFPLDGLFCEWAYVIDLDSNMLECYEGFHKDVPKDGKWAGKRETSESEYAAVHLVKRYSFFELPTEDQFIKDLEPDEEDEEEE